ncbi:helix-turn-helix domain-containing protein [Pararhizobium gei]|uniref:helix-turn-helix domain-containing protein n=1 Tax=Pararhizobium gei TaxID=1395951 RepID=UPI00331300CE
MKINQKFKKDNPEVWGSIRSANAIFKADRWKWRRELRTSDLPASALRVGLALVDEWGRNAEVFPSFDTIAEVTGLKRRAVKCGIEALREAGLIATHKTGISDSLRYYFVSREYVNTSLREVAVEGPRRDANTAFCRDVDTSFGTDAFTSGNLSQEPDESNLNTSSSCDGAAALQDLPTSDPSFAPDGAQGVEIPRQVTKERRSA